MMDKEWMYVHEKGLFQFNLDISLEGLRKIKKISIEIPLDVDAKCTAFYQTPMFSEKKFWCPLPEAATDFRL